MVWVEKVVPLQFAGNITVCRRVNENILLAQMQKDLLDDVRDQTDETNLQENIVYAMRKKGKKHWKRVTVKFVRKCDNVVVLQNLDEKGVHDFDPENMQVRKVHSNQIRDQTTVLFKIMIYAVIAYKQKKEYELIFNEMLKGKEVTAVYDLIEKKSNAVHECYAGDFLCEFNGRLLSFREILIREKIAYPRHAETAINQNIFKARADILCHQNQKRTIMFETDLQSVSVPNESFDSIDLISDRYRIRKIAGEGTVGISFFDLGSFCFNQKFCLFQFHCVFGVVVKGVDEETSESIAIKIFKSGLFESNSAVQKHLKEAKIMAELDHSYIVPLLDQVLDENGIFLIFPFISLTLFDEIYHEKYEYDFRRTQEVLFMLLSAVNYMHNKKLAHRDLKPNNILSNEFGVVKFCDFGLSEWFNESEQFMSIKGTKSYMAPEIWLEIGYTHQVDVWVC